MKDPNAPKRPLSGYMRFIGTIRKEVVAETGLTGIKVTPILSKRWKALTEEERQTFNAQFKVEMQEHKKVMEAYKQTEEYRQFQEIKKSKKFKKKPKDKNAPKKAPSAYFVFCNEKRKSVRAEKPNATMKEMGETFGKLWKALDAEARKPYFARNLEKKTKWQEEFAAYKETENYALHQEKLKKFKKAKDRAYGKVRKTVRKTKKSKKKTATMTTDEDTV